MAGFGSVVGAAIDLGNTIYDSYWKERNISENWDMWHANNVYNSPENQVKRLRQAGLNPALAMQQGALGSGTSSSPPSPFSNTGVPSMGNIQEGLRIDNESRLARSQSAKLDQETEAERIRNKFAMIRQYLDLRKLASDGSLSASQTRRYNREADYLEKEINSYDAVTQSTIRANNAKARLDDANAQLQELEFKFKPDEWQKILRNLDKEGNRIDSAIRVNDSQAAYNYALEAVENARKEGLEIDNQLARDTADAYVDQKYSDAEYAAYKWQREAKIVSGGIYADKLPAKVDSEGYHSYHERPYESRHHSSVPKHKK